MKRSSHIPRMIGSALVFWLFTSCGRSPIAPTATMIQTTPTPTPILPTPTSAYQTPDHRIGIRTVEGQAEFFDQVTGERFVPWGVNYHWVYTPDGQLTANFFEVGVYNHDRVLTDLAELAELGYNTFRIFIDLCAPPYTTEHCIGNSPGEGLRSEVLENIADCIAIAKEIGIYLLLTSNDLPYEGGYWTIVDREASDQMVGYRGASYLTESGIEATRKYWRDLLQGLIEIEAPLDAVLAWELVNEQWMFNSEPPLSLSSGTISTLTGEYDLSDRDEKQAMVIDGLRYYISEVREEILSHDPTALVTMGFFAPNYPHWDIVADIDWYVDTAPLVEESDLDFLDFHVYMGGDLTLREYAENFGMIGYWDRPIILGEFGANRGDYSTITWAGLEFIRIMRETCNLGFQGWLFWTNRTNDDFWVFSDQDGYLQDLLSPANLGDPCE